MILQLRFYGDPVLTRKTDPITVFDAELKQLVVDLLETLKHEDGGGLAAPQVGISKAICALTPGGTDLGNCVFDGKPIPAQMLFPLVIVNPKNVRFFGQPCVYTEGCLSIPGNIWINIERPEGIEFEFQDVDGHAHTIRADGKTARVMEHELDHLEGILFTTRAHPRDRMRFETKLKMLKRDTLARLKSAGKGTSNARSGA